MQIAKCKFALSNFEKAVGFLNAEQFSLENCSSLHSPISNSLSIIPTDISPIPY